ncbi:MAG TPA: helix-turn-helix domain-containing protein [Candidatus Angelobacter sp.]|jgi:DNA-binding HxlR family transcriptional regulator|nr:helix-turn-helix domain-containing protein [Candidatus Angelobacter sp.]
MDDATFCPVHEAIQVLQEKWTLHIVRALLDRPLGFNELGRAAGGCNPATLAQRLDRLEELGVVTRTVESVMPPRTSYRLTPAGVELQEVISAIDHWGRRHIKERLAAHIRGCAAEDAPTAAAAS